LEMDRIIKFLFVVSTHLLLTSSQEFKRQAITRLNYGVIIHPKQSTPDPENFMYSKSQMKMQTAYVTQTTLVLHPVRVLNHS